MFKLPVQECDRNLVELPVDESVGVVIIWSGKVLEDGVEMLVR